MLSKRKPWGPPRTCCPELLQPAQRLQWIPAIPCKLSRALLRLQLVILTQKPLVKVNSRALRQPELALQLEQPSRVPEFPPWLPLMLQWPIPPTSQAMQGGRLAQVMPQPPRVPAANLALPRQLLPDPQLLLLMLQQVERTLLVAARTTQGAKRTTRQASELRLAPTHLLHGRMYLVLLSSALTLLPERDLTMLLVLLPLPPMVLRQRVTKQLWSVLACLEEVKKKRKGLG